MAGMTDQRPARLLLELETTDAETIAGRVSNTEGTAVEFAGWLGLAGAIEAALRHQAEADDGRSAHTGGRGHE